LPPGFSLSDIAASVSGLGLVKALLPRRGARLSIEASGATVLARLQLFPPAVREKNVLRTAQGIGAMLMKTER